jgi:hypothetical protein
VRKVVSSSQNIRLQVVVSSNLTVLYSSELSKIYSHQINQMLCSNVLASTDIAVS